jgi:hypothetical protein
MLVAAVRTGKAHARPARGGFVVAPAPGVQTLTGGRIGRYTAPRRPPDVLSPESRNAVCQEESMKWERMDGSATGCL